MEHVSDVTLLRRELIKAAREAERRAAEAAEKFEEYEVVIDGLHEEILDLKRRLAHYENPRGGPRRDPSRPPGGGQAGGADPAAPPP